jgi:hypothetical protein
MSLVLSSNFTFSGQLPVVVGFAATIANRFQAVGIQTFTTTNGTVRLSDTALDFSDVSDLYDHRRGFRPGVGHLYPRGGE